MFLSGLGAGMCPRIKKKVDVHVINMSKMSCRKVKTLVLVFWTNQKADNSLGWSRDTDLFDIRHVDIVFDIRHVDDTKMSTKVFDV